MDTGFVVDNYNYLFHWYHLNYSNVLIYFEYKPNEIITCLRIVMNVFHYLLFNDS